MKRSLPSVLMAVVLFLVWGANAQTTAQKKAPVKTGTPAKTASGKKSPAKTPAKTTASTKKGPAKKGAAAPKRPAVTWRNRQLAPTTDRYREIQTALAEKGYLKSEDANGAWNQNSIDALKHFQEDQKLDPSGKINSLSLIALGLGPKRDATAVTPPKPPQ
jgi:hypothetical protein